MKKKALSILLAVWLLIGCLPLAAEAESPTSGKCGSNVTWSLDTSTGEMVIEGTGPMDDYFCYDWCAAPWGIENPDIRSVVIKPGVLSVADYAFYLCRNITSVTLPETVTQIGDSAFAGCIKLTEITLPHHLEYLGESALEGTDIASIVIPDGVMRIEDFEFRCCERLTSVTIPDSVTSIGDFAFNSCVFTSITLPDSVTMIGDCSFADTAITSITIPNSVVYIDEDAFWGCEDLTSVILSNRVTRIKKETFSHCYSLTSVTIPDSVTSIGEEAFSHCYSLASITIPNSVTDIGKGTFANCSDLTSITIPESVIGIGEGAFAGCSEDLTIYGAAGSYAETYANENGIHFVAVETTDPAPTPAPGPVKPAPGPAAPAEPEPAPAASSFVDVPKGAYYEEAINWAVENNITSGTDSTHFSPNQSCTRAQAVTFLWRATGEPEPQNAATRFSDVKESAYYEKAVQWAIENGITSGTGETTFSPNSPCTRAQIITFLYRAENSPETSGDGSFTDVKAGAYYENAVKWAVENNITSGTGGNKFSPDNDCARGQIITFLYRSYAG